MTSTFRPRPIGSLMLLGALLQGGCAPADEAIATTSAITFATTGHYTSKTPYAEPSQVTLEPPPAGFRPLMVQHVARHGSRPLSSPGDDDLAFQLWQQARDEGALTPLGRMLGPVLEDILAVHAEVGYGALSMRGAREHEQMAERLARRQPALLEQALADQRRIRVFHSGRERAELSALAFVRGLADSQPELTVLIDTPEPAPATVYFNDAAETAAAEAYRRYREEDARLEATLGRLVESPETMAMARRMLEALFTAEFVDRLAVGAYSFEAEADPDDRIDNEVQAAAILYALYSIAVNMDLEADWDFGRFIDPDAAAWFAYVDDAESFYERGPGFDDEDVTWRAAEVLLADMLDTTAAVISGRANDVAVLRFSHAQAMIPIAALLGIAGTHEALPESIMYSYDVSDWRTGTVSPMAANVQWDVYQNNAGIVLVRMLHNESPALFRSGCDTWGDTSSFYVLEELYRCFGFDSAEAPTKRPSSKTSYASVADCMPSRVVACLAVDAERRRWPGPSRDHAGADRAPRISRPGNASVG